MGDPFTEVGGGALVTYMLVAALKKIGVKSAVATSILVVVISAALQAVLTLLEQPGATAADWARALVKAIISAVLASATHLSVKNAKSSIAEAKANGA